VRALISLFNILVPIFIIVFLKLSHALHEFGGELDLDVLLMRGLNLVAK
jgi:hypothetical protein